MKSETKQQNHSRLVEGSSDCNELLHSSHPRNSLPAPAQMQSQQVSSRSTPLRRGKWSPEEETYALAAIRDFNWGYLDLPPGATLRTYLSEKLHCDPMRIQKKFTGDASIGKKVFHPAVTDGLEISKDIEDSQAKLEHLYQKWKHQLESQEQGMAQKYMADAAVSVASSFCDNQNLTFSTASSPSHLLGGGSFLRGLPEMMNTSSVDKVVYIQSAKTKNDITKTASWLEQADALLSKKTEGNISIQKEIEEEMKAISHLIKEAAYLPKLLDNKYNIESSKLQASIHKLRSCPDLGRLCTNNTDMEDSEQFDSTLTTRKRKRSLSYDTTGADSPNNPMRILASLSSQAAPVSIYANVNHTTAGSSTKKSKSDAEDAKTFVNFLKSVVHGNKC
eukprot:CAMPEP_0172305600 /NCGR_PEP_ID=MMETSP1058-20130122/6855_1 /TAXON_ID=83371 /ORGANISM="Detonula confervacea, Strain CCMP 353" /LENGTH=390 /DNA_ID=CAMNT_0013017241 /DNA_START=122 /DNA_END=1295 /DNA_ORIENTATION=+